MFVIKPGPGNIVKTAILPGVDESVDFHRIRSKHRRKFVIWPGPGKIVKIAIMPGVDKSLDSNQKTSFPPLS